MESLPLTGPVWLMQPIPYFGEPLDGRWWYEPKIDGWRLQLIRYPDGRVETWGRRLERHPNWTERLALISEIAQQLFPSGLILDCELSTHLGRRFIPSVLARNPKIPPVIYIFDLIFYENRFIGDQSLKERRMILSSFKVRPPFRLIPKYRLTDVSRALTHLSGKGYEGVVLKQADSPYTLSPNGPIATEYWRKLKPGR